MPFILLFFSIFNATQADETSKKTYPLLENKINLSTCYTNASVLHLGLLEKQWLMNENNHFFMQYEIQDNHNKIWLTICDLDNGHILKDQTIDVVTDNNMTQ